MLAVLLSVLMANLLFNTANRLHLAFYYFLIYKMKYNFPQLLFWKILNLQVTKKKNHWTPINLSSRFINCQYFATMYPYNYHTYHCGTLLHTGTLESSNTQSRLKCPHFPQAFLYNFLKNHHVLHLVIISL